MLSYVPPFTPHQSGLPSQSSAPLSRSRRHVNPVFAPIRRVLVARVRRGHTPEPEIRKNLFQVANMKDIDFQPVEFSSFHGKVVLAVNVASSDRFTEPVYSFLTKMLEKYQDSGFEVLAFPCNWFGQKETGLNEEIKKFVQEKYSKRITLMSKYNIEWNEVFALGQKHFPEEIIWNFHGKFLFNRYGKPIGRFDLLSEDEFIEGAIQKALAETPPPPPSPKEVRDTANATNEDQAEQELDNNTTRLEDDDQAEQELDNNTTLLENENQHEQQPGKDIALAQEQDQDDQQPDEEISLTHDEDPAEQKMEMDPSVVTSE